MYAYRITSHQLYLAQSSRPPLYGHRENHHKEDLPHQRWPRGELDPATAIAYFRELAAMGIDQAIVSLPNVADLEPFELFATEIIPVVEQSEVAGR